jgi:HSP20 family protein
MSIGDWHVFGDLARLRRGLNRFSQEMRAGLRPDNPEEGWAPPVDIYEQDSALVLLIDLPGVRREGIALSVDHENVTVEGHRPGAGSGTAVRVERQAGRFRRSFRIGTPIDPAGVQASYRDGVLRITIPRAATAGPVRLRVDVE